jgi:membrane-associated phospholipid phosphatase
MWVANAVSMSFIAAFIIPGALWLRGDAWGGRLLGAVVATNLAVVGIKQAFGSASVFGRPPGAVGCDTLCLGDPVGGQPGFPSGHVATATVLVSALWVHDGGPLVLAVGLPWVAAMAWSRWTKQCHNWVQIAGGAVLGTVIGRMIT